MKRDTKDSKNKHVVDLVVALIWTVVGSIIILGIGFPVFHFVSRRSDYLVNQAHILSIAGKRLETYIDTGVSALVSAADTGYAGDEELYRKVVFPLFPWFSAVAYVSNDVDSPLVFTPQGLSPDIRLETGFPGSEWVQRAAAIGERADATGVSRAYVSGLAEGRLGQGMGVFLSVPVRDRSGRPGGLLYAEIPQEAIAEVIREYSFGKTGRVFVKDGTGRMIACSAMSCGDIPVSIASIYRESAEGKPFLVSEADVPALGWKLMASTASSEVFPFLGLYVGIILLIVFCSIGLSIFNYRKTLCVTSETERQRRELMIISETDPLTGLLNRRSMLSRIAQLAAETTETDKDLVVIMFDIDDFKQCNDSLGHVFGDRVLREIAARTVSVLRVEDLLFRWGGEEFLAIIKNCDLDSGYGVAEKIRQAIANTPISDGQRSQRVTVTLGVSRYRGEGIESMIQHADEALYEGKRLGKNRTLTSDY